MNELEKIQVQLATERDNNTINARELDHWVKAKREGDADLELLAKRCIDLEGMIKECIEAMDYALDHEHDAWWHEIDTGPCKFCARIEPTLLKAKEMLGVK